MEKKEREVSLGQFIQEKFLKTLAILRKKRERV